MSPWERDSSDEEVIIQSSADRLRAQEVRAGKADGELCRKMGMAEAAFRVRRKKCGGLGHSEVKRLRLLEEESRDLKQSAAKMSLVKAMLPEVVTKRL